MKHELIKALAAVAAPLGIDAASLKLDYPENPDHGDLSSNIAMAHAKKLGMAPKALAEKIIAAFDSAKPDFIESVSIAGPGFINFKVKDRVFAESVISISKENEYGWGSADKGKKVMVEYTNPNPFKIFHIGHLMDNAIGESISRLVESQGAEVKRAIWQGDVGLHVAKTVWAMMKQEPRMKELEKAPVVEQVRWLGEMYVQGNNAYEEAGKKDEIAAVNKKIFEQSDPRINAFYARGREWSLDYFETIYKRLGTKFDNYFFEGIEGKNGERIVREFQKKGVFEESEGAIVFKGEKHGLHTRVFITSQGLPAYEAKELGLNTEKFKVYPELDESIIVTANEINDYFKVLLKVLELIAPNIAKKTKHLSHGILRFASGKMSSRKGNVVAAEDLINDIKQQVAQKMSDRELSPEESDQTTDMIAIGAIKYTILRQAIGGDVIFDSAASISFEGDSGPYLQYSTVRANSVHEKAGKDKDTDKDGGIAMPEKVGLLEKLITRFPDILVHAREEYAPQHVANYLINLAGAFNSFYASNPILDENEPLSPYRIALTRAFYTTMRNGLWVLGIQVPKKM